jgi:hypothetical protein
MSGGPNITPIGMMVQNRLQEFDSQFGGLMDAHIKWIKGYVYYQLNTKMVRFYFDNTSSPRRLLVMPLMPDGKIISIFSWLKFQAKLILLKNPDKPLLHPAFWPQEMDLIDCSIKFIRQEPKEAVHD